MTTLPEDQRLAGISPKAYEHPADRAATAALKSIPMLDAAAIAAVKQWVFKPALSNNKPVAVWVAVPVKFTLN